MFKNQVLDHTNRQKSCKQNVPILTVMVSERPQVKNQEIRPGVFDQRPTGRMRSSNVFFAVRVRFL
jgi:hypothetical protein